MKKVVVFLALSKFAVKVIWLHVIIMLRTSFRVNPGSIVCLNVKEFLARTRCHIWNLRDSNEIRTHNHLVRKRTLNNLYVHLRTKWLWVRISLLSLKLIRICRIQWWSSLFLFWTGNTFLGKFGPKSQNYHFKLEFCR